MRSQTRLAVAGVLAVLLVGMAAVPAAAVPGPADECQNADSGPAADAGPPGFVAGLVEGLAGFLGDLFAGLPVPNFVKGFFGASGC